MKKSCLALSVCLFGAFCFSPNTFAKPHHKGPEHIQKFGNHHKMKDGAKFGLKNGLKDGFKDGWKGHKKNHGDFSKQPERAPNFEQKPFGDFKDRPDGDRKFWHGKYPHVNRPAKASEDIQISTER